jgi:hypothetical protein
MQADGSRERLAVRQRRSPTADSSPQRNEIASINHGLPAPCRHLPRHFRRGHDSGSRVISVANLPICMPIDFNVILEIAD